MQRLAAVIEIERARRVRRHIRETANSIRAGRLLPGQVLDLAEAADQLKLTIAQLRFRLCQCLSPDLAMLVGGQLVVTPLDPREVRELFETRLMLTPANLITLTAADRLRPAPATPEDVLVRLDSAMTDDRGYAQSVTACMNFVAPALTPSALLTAEDLIWRTERATRLGWRLYRESCPDALAEIAVAAWNAAQARHQRSWVGIQETASAYLRARQRMALHAAYTIAP